MGVVSCVAALMGWLDSIFPLDFSFEKGCMVKSDGEDDSIGIDHDLFLKRGALPWMVLFLYIIESLRF